MKKEIFVMRNIVLIISFINIYKNNFIIITKIVIKYVLKTKIIII